MDGASSEVCEVDGFHQCFLLGLTLLVNSELVAKYFD